MEVSGQYGGQWTLRRAKLEVSGENGGQWSKYRSLWADDQPSVTLALFPQNVFPSQSGCMNALCTLFLFEKTKAVLLCEEDELSPSEQIGSAGVSAAGMPLRQDGM